MDCIECGGKGCKECEETGKLQITQCPLESIPAEIWEIIHYAELYEKGLAPVAGGALDQAKIFTATARFIFREQAYWKKKLGIFD